MTAFYPASLVSEQDILTGATLEAALGKTRMQRVLFYPEIDSTNLRLHELAQTGAASHGLVAVADKQTAGKGRLGRSFHSPQNKGIYLSMLLLPGSAALPACPSADLTSPSVWMSLTSRVAVAVCNAIETVCQIRPGIKWVNDLYLNQKKICGILTEMELEKSGTAVRQIIVGIGINVLETPDDFPEELQATASSIAWESRRRISRTALTAALIRELDELAARWPAGLEEDLIAYRRDSIVLGRSITVLPHDASPDPNERPAPRTDEPAPVNGRPAYAEAIEDDFALRVRYEDGSHEFLRGGEISIRI